MECVTFHATKLFGQNVHYYRHLTMIFPSRSQLASKQITRTGRAEAVTKEGLAATLLPGRQPDQMGQRHSSTASTSSIVPGSAKERVLMLYFNTNVGATLIRIQIGSRRQGFAFAASRPGRLRADLKGWLFKRERGV